MKKNLFIMAVLLSMAITTIAQVGIGTENPSSSAVLELSSTKRGLLFPRMTYTQMRQISNPEKGLVVYCSDCSGGTIMMYDGGYWQFLSKGFYNSNIIVDSYGNEYGTVEGHYSDNGHKRTWLDKNLGASRKATSAYDHQAYGSLFQFGRYSDGHELVGWGEDGSVVITDTQSGQESDHYPFHAKFITTTNNNNWTTSNQPLWDKDSDINTNNPCPSGYRVPTKKEWLDELGQWNTEGKNAFTSELKLPKAGKRKGNDGSYDSDSYDNISWYWTSEDESIKEALAFKDDGFVINYKADGLPVRCINEE